MSFGSRRACVVLACALLAPAAAAPPPATPAAPVDAVTGIVEAFKTHRLVALPESHGGRQLHGFLLSLLRDARLADAVDDVVVAIGNSRHQAVVDRFVAGQDVPYESLRAAWRDTMSPNNSGELPTHEEVFRAVRAANAARPGRRQVRIVLAEPPIDWDAVKTADDYRRWNDMRVAHAAAIVQTEVLAKGRRALLVLGLPDLQRRNVFSNYDMSDWRAQTVVSALEATSPTKVFTIWAVSPAQLAARQANAAAWRLPSLAQVRGTVLGAADFVEFFWDAPRAEFVDGKPMLVPRERWRPLRAEEQFDAVLVLGKPAPDDAMPLPASICTEPGYLEARLRRLATAGLPPPVADELRTRCPAP